MWLPSLLRFVRIYGMILLLILPFFPLLASFFINAPLLFVVWLSLLIIVWILILLCIGVWIDTADRLRGFVFGILLGPIGWMVSYFLTNSLKQKTIIENQAKILNALDSLKTPHEKNILLQKEILNALNHIRC